MHKARNNSLSILVSGLALTACAGHTQVAAGEATSPSQISTAAQPMGEEADLQRRITALDIALEAQRVKFGIPGMSVAIVKGDKILLMKGYGLADVGAGKPADANTIFPIGSTTKPMTTVTLAMAMADTGASFEEHPRKYLPYFKLKDPVADREVRIKHLVSHTSGLGRTDFAWLTGRVTREEAIRLAGMAESTAPLGRFFQYQNVMFAAAGAIAGNLSGGTWERLMHERLFRPLGMTATATSLKEAKKLGNVSQGYLLGEKPALAPIQETSSVGPAGSVHSSARDMARWLQFAIGRGTFNGRSLLARPVFDKLLEPQMQTIFAAQYGLGWFLSDRAGVNVVNHPGVTSGFKSQMAFLPDHDIGYVVLTNADRTPFIPVGSIGPADETILAHLLDDPSKSGQSVPAAPADALTSEHAAVLGRYRMLNDPVNPLEIIDRDGRLMIVPSPGQEFVLDAPANDRFHIRGLPAAYATSVRRGPAGKVIGLTLHEPDPRRERHGVPIQAYTAPLTADELTQRMSRAAGGAKALIRHPALRAAIESNLINQGVKGGGTILANLRGDRAETVTYWAFGKCLAANHTFINGSTGGRFSTSGAAETFNDVELAAHRAALPFHPVFSAPAIFRSAAIIGEMDVEREPAYILVRTPDQGSPVTELVSKKSFRILRRHSTVAGGPRTEDYEDYRLNEGVLVPHRITIRRGNSDLGVEVLTVKAIDFLPTLPANAFAPPQTLPCS